MNNNTGQIVAHFTIPQRQALGSLGLGVSIGIATGLANLKLLSPRAFVITSLLCLGICGTLNVSVD